VRAAIRCRKQGSEVAGSEASQLRAHGTKPGFDTDWHQFNPTRTALPRVSHQAGLDAAESDRHVRIQHGPVDFPCAGVQSAGKVAGYYQGGAQFLQGGNQLGCSPTQASTGPRTKQGIDDCIVAGAHDGEFFGVPGLQAQGPTTGGGKSSQCPGMDFRGGEDRRRAHSATGKEGCGEKTVSTVVSLACKDRDAGAAQLAFPFDLPDYLLRQPVGCPLHKNSALTGVQERFFRIPDLLSGEGADHCL
jgi:hypothetical protein